MGSSNEIQQLLEKAIKRISDVGANLYAAETIAHKEGLDMAEIFLAHIKGQLIQHQGFLMEAMEHLGDNDA